jgi:hypothetical protein
MESLGAGWRLVRANLGNVVILIVITFIIGLIWAFALGFVALLVGGLLGIAPGLLTYLLTQSGGVSIVAAIPGILLTIVVLSVLNTVWTVFHETIWTLAYRALPNRPDVSGLPAPMTPTI